MSLVSRVTGNQDPPPPGWASVIGHVISFPGNPQITQRPRPLKQIRGQ